MATVEIQEQVPLAALTTIGVGGPARFFAEIRSEQQLLEAFAFARQHRLPTVAVGGGSNLLVHDEGYPGLLLRMAIVGPIRQRERDAVTEQTVPAGLSWDEFVRQACEQGLSGVECLAGIPGLTGGTPVQNVGAYGQEVAQTIVSVRALDRATQHFVRLSREDCGFRYRSSLFNAGARDRYLITSVTFALERNASPALRYDDLRRHFGEGARPGPMAIYHAVRAIREAKGMLIVAGDPDCRSAGSFFKNPVIDRRQLAKIAGVQTIAVDRVPHWPVPDSDSVKLAAAWLVEQAGFGKGFQLGAAGISSRHSLALINRTGTARFADIAQLRDLIRGEVQARFGLRLEQEPIELGPETPAAAPDARRTATAELHR